LDSQFHCSYLDSRGVPGKTREIITLLFPVHDFRWCNFRSRLRKRSLPVTSRSPSIPHKCEVDGASILLAVPVCCGIWLTSWRTWIDLVLQYTLEFYLTCLIVFASRWFRSRPVCHTTFVFFYKKLVFQYIPLIFMTDSCMIQWNLYNLTHHQFVHILSDIYSCI
jgi:hypothetical protein